MLYDPVVCVHLVNVSIIEWLNIKNNTWWVRWRVWSLREYNPCLLAITWLYEAFVWSNCDTNRGWFDERNLTSWSCLQNGDHGYISGYPGSIFVPVTCIESICMTDGGWTFSYFLFPYPRQVDFDGTDRSTDRSCQSWQTCTQTPLLSYGSRMTLLLKTNLLCCLLVEHEQRGPWSPDWSLPWFWWIIKWSSVIITLDSYVLQPSLECLKPKSDKILSHCVKG